MMRIISALCPALTAFILISGCIAKKEESVTYEETHIVDYVNLRDVISQTGEVRPLVKLDLKCEASGRIEKLFVKEGQLVSKGDTLLIIDPERLLYKRERTALSVRRAEIKMNQARRDYEHTASLYETGTVSEKSLEDRKSEHELAEIAFKQVQLELKDLDDELEKTVIISPMSGVLTSLNVEEGEIAVSATSGFQSGTTIGTIADISKLEVVSQIGEVDYVHLEPGQHVAIRPEAFEHAQTQGTITFISLSAKKSNNDELGTFEVRISVDSIIPGISPGINVNAEFVILDKKNVLGVPNHFVRKRGSAYFVDVVPNAQDGAAKTEQRKIKVGKTDYKHYEVVSGLARGEVVYFKEGDGNEDKKRRGRRGK
ncbi:MAG: efflux RND transporter periplasmic adaptor subunit [Chitinivibrionales bacterium]|nr:efflux RND transporter periplasmic adaptor subunit [Chitinivibrionales bacterium]